MTGSTLTGELTISADGTAIDPGEIGRRFEAERRRINDNALRLADGTLDEINAILRKDKVRLLEDQHRLLAARGRTLRFTLEGSTSPLPRTSRLATPPSTQPAN